MPVSVQVFDVVMNGDLTVVPALDIFSRVGRGVAHDEYVPFMIAANTLIVGGQESILRGNKVRVDFLKVCAKMEIGIIYSQSYGIDAFWTYDS